MWVIENPEGSCTGFLKRASWSKDENQQQTEKPSVIIFCDRRWALATTFQLS